MYVSMSVYMRVFVRVDVYTHWCLCMRVVCISMRERICMIHIYVCRHLRKHLCIYVCMYACMCVYVCLWICIYACMYVYACFWKCVFTCACVYETDRQTERDRERVIERGRECV
jgi:hypothetical protein